MPQLYELSKDIPEADERRRTFVLDTAKSHGNQNFICTVW